MSSPESALFLREIFDNEFYKLKTSGPDVYYFGSVIKRQEEKIDDYNSFKSYIEEYHKVGIKKYFGLTVIEYLDLTPYEKNTLCDQAAGFAKEELEMAKEAARASSEDLRNLEHSNNSIMDMFEGDML